MHRLNLTYEKPWQYVEKYLEENKQYLDKFYQSDDDLFWLQNTKSGLLFSLR